MFSRNRWSRGAISVEYIIILVLIAIGGIIGFIMLSGQMRNQVGTSVRKLGGSETTNTATKTTDTTRLDKAAGMDGTDDQSVNAGEANFQ